jgi:urease accessory protein
LTRIVKRACNIKRMGAWRPGEAIDRVVLDADDRQRRRIVLTGESGARFMLDLEKPAALKDGDGLVLEDGTIVRVVSRPEPLFELSAKTPLLLVRLAWHLGNRHADMQIAGERLRIRRDHVLRQMAAGVGADITPIEAPFDPEVGSPSDHHHEHCHGA